MEIGKLLARTKSEQNISQIIKSHSRMLDNSQMRKHSPSKFEEHRLISQGASFQGLRSCEFEIAEFPQRRFYEQIIVKDRRSRRQAFDCDLGQTESPESPKWVVENKISGHFQ